MRYQQSWVASDAVTVESQVNLERTLRTALDHGITHFETARGYGTSEKQIGDVLPHFDRDTLIVQTKVAPTEDPNQFERDVRDSLTRLRLPHVDLLALHGVNDEQMLEWSLRPGGCLERALALKAQGLTRHIGFSTHAALDVITAAIRDGRFDYVNLHYYWAFQNNASAVAEAAARDMGVFIISPSDKGGHLYNPPRTLVELTAPLSPMVFNDLWCLSHPAVHTISIGARVASDFDEHLRAARLLEEHSSDIRALIAPIEARLQVKVENALGKQWANTWSVGLPEWQQMPGGINVREILRLYNMARTYDMTEYARSRYNLLDGAGHWFPGNNARLASTLDRREALTASPHATIIPQRLAEAHALLAGAQQKRLQRDA
jgi:predicted aldo/keto reductase-like oxidoreductase